MIDDEENCHCGPCTAMNEPLTLEGDIRYLKAHIETKNRQLAEKDNALYDAEFRIRIYRDAVIDAENENNRLREENERLTLYRTMIDDLSAQNRALRGQVDLLNTHKARYQEEILDLEKEVMMMRDIESDQIAKILALEGTIEDYAGVVQRLRNIFRVAHDAVELFVKG